MRAILREHEAESNLDEPITPEPSEEEDEEVAIARAEREKAANDLFIQDLARLGVPVNFLLDYRERAIGQFGPRLDRIESKINSSGQSPLNAILL